MSDDTAIFLWVALFTLSLLGIASWGLVEGVYAIRRSWVRFRCWWLYGRHGAAYKRSVVRMGRRYQAMREASYRLGRYDPESERDGK
jgi:hypothetical protein